MNAWPWQTCRKMSKVISTTDCGDDHLRGAAAAHGDHSFDDEDGGDREPHRVDLDGVGDQHADQGRCRIP